MADVKEAVRPRANGPQVAPKPTPPAPETEARAEVKPAYKAAGMAPMIATPFAFIRRFAEEMDRLFEDFGIERGLHMPGFLTRGHELLRRETGLVEAEWSPHIDIHQAEGRMIVRADLPGLTRNDIKVEVTPETLTIQGERKGEKKEERKGYSYSECSYGSFYRAIPLPEGVDTTGVTADFQNGVLQIGIPLPAPPEAKARRVEVKEKS